MPPAAGYLYEVQRMAQGGMVIFMDYKIITDSCCEFLDEWLNDSRFERVGRGIAGEPSPEEYLEAMKTDASYIFVFTLSGKVSRSYHSAMSARHMMNMLIKKEGLPEKKIFVCDSKSVSGGETMLAIKAVEMLEDGMEFSDICVNLMFFRNRLKTYLWMEGSGSMAVDYKMNFFSGLLFKCLKVKPIMGSLDGEMIKIGYAAGIRRMSHKILTMLKSEIKESESKTIIITQCNAFKKAEKIGRAIQKKYQNCRVVIVNSMDDGIFGRRGGVIVAI